MTNSIDLSRIDFHGFSSSKNWIGYFQWIGIVDETKKSEYNQELIHKAGLLLYEYFKDCWNDFFVLSGLRYDDEAENETGADELYGNVYNKAKEIGLLIPVDDEYEKWSDYKWFKLPKTQIPLHFLRFCFDKDFILPYSEMAMAMVFGKICGQKCFLINPKLQIALYPHDDIGYGCIDLGDNPKILTDFLNYCDKNQDFISHIEEQYR